MDDIDNIWVLGWDEADQQFFRETLKDMLARNQDIFVRGVNKAVVLLGLFHTPEELDPFAEKLTKMRRTSEKNDNNANSGRRRLPRDFEKYSY